MVPVYTLLMLMVRGIPALMLYRDVLTRGQRGLLLFVFRPDHKIDPLLQTL